MELPRNLWVKSPVELEQEREGMRLFSNWDPAFSIPGRNPVELYEDVKKYEAETGRQFEQKMLHKAYDRLTCRIQRGASMYIRAPELITDSQVVLRDWQILQDEEYKGNVEEVLRHAEICRASNEESLRDVDGILKELSLYGF